MRSRVAPDGPEGVTVGPSWGFLRCRLPSPQWLASGRAAPAVRHAPVTSGPRLARGPARYKWEGQWRSSTVAQHVESAASLLVASGLARRKRRAAHSSISSSDSSTNHHRHRSVVRLHSGTAVELAVPPALSPRILLPARRRCHLQANTQWTAGTTQDLRPHSLPLSLSPSLSLLPLPRSHRSPPGWVLPQTRSCCPHRPAGRASMLGG